MKKSRFIEDQVAYVLRSADFDVRAASECLGDVAGIEVITLSVEEASALRTEDKEIGPLVFAANRESAGARAGVIDTRNLSRPRTPRHDPPHSRSPHGCFELRPWHERLQGPA